MTDRSEEWGPWIDHDGRECPCVGKYVQIKFHDGIVMEGIAGEKAAQAVAHGFDPFVSWKWAIAPTICVFFEAARIVRYRIRKPRALQQLRELVENLPATQRERINS